MLDVLDFVSILFFVKTLNAENLVCIKQKSLNAQLIGKQNNRYRHYTADREPAIQYKSVENMTQWERKEIS